MSDLISRQALRDAMYHEAFETDTEMQRWDSGCWIRYKLFENVIDNLSSTEHKGKLIRWMEKKETPTYISYTPHCKCSECGNELIIDYINYCYVCGAKMEGEEE